MYKKSPLRSPLREVLKNQCRERMKSNRDNVVGRMRNIQMEDKDMLENEIRLVVKVCFNYLRKNCFILFPLRMSLLPGEEDVNVCPLGIPAKILMMH